MHVLHLLRKYNPAEWGGTETAVKRLLDGLRHHEVVSTVYCPELNFPFAQDPLRENGHTVKCFKTCVPVWGISTEQRQQLVSVGGNLMSFDLMPRLLKEPNVSLIHTHAGNRLGGIALSVAKIKRVPLVATIHGGVLDLPESAREFLRKPLQGGFEWGKIFGLFLQSRKVLSEADAILTCNKKEAELQQKQFPNKRVIVQPHGVNMQLYAQDQRNAARSAFPKLQDRNFLLVVGRIDPVKNQLWVVEQFPEVLKKFPKPALVLAGSCTDAGYGKLIEKRIQELGLENDVILTGGLSPSDPRLIGLFQAADATILPSLSETFGLVILESWAAGTTVISSRTSGAREVVRDGENGYFFDHNAPAEFHRAVEALLKNPELRTRFASSGKAVVAENYDVNVLGGRVKRLYAELIEEKK
jgi:glycosyltransferase involved in cell wall biosynthesis